MYSFLQKHSYLLVATGLIFTPVGWIFSLAGLFAHGESGPPEYGLVNIGRGISGVFGFVLLVGTIISLIKSIKEGKYFLIALFSSMLFLFVWVFLRNVPIH